MATASIKSRQQHFMARRFGEDVANRVTNTATPPSTSPAKGGGTPDTLKPSSPTATRRSYRLSAARSSASPTISVTKVNAVPFPSICEELDEGEDSMTNSFDPTAEDIRGQEWATEIARRQASIKELRDRKLRLEQTHSTTRARKGSPPSSSSRLQYLTSLDRKFSTDDIEFLSALHASVVWRLWHVDLTPEVFSAERLLATRLHLVLMRYGRQNIPVPPIVSLSTAHHLVNSQTLQARNMIEKDRPGIQTLPQLVAKSMLRQSKPKKSLARRASNRALRATSEANPPVPPPHHHQAPSSPLAKGAFAPMRMEVSEDD